MDTMDNTNGSTKRLDQRIDALEESIRLRAEYSVQLSIAEAKRIDAIRAVDVQAVTVASERANASALVLASQVSSSAEALRILVAQTATAVASQLASMSSAINDRISALEKSQYQNSGKETGGKDMWGWIVGGIMAVVAIGSFILPHLR